MQTESCQEKHLGGGTTINAIRCGERGQQRGTTKVAKVAASGVARVSRRAVSPFVATYLCKWSRRRLRPHLCRSPRANTHESNEIAPVMWGVLTRLRPAPSTQTIENKRTILRHPPRAPRKTGITRYLVIHFTLVVNQAILGLAPLAAKIGAIERGLSKASGGVH